MLQLIECAGNPRDMGHGQGEACRAAVTERVLRAGLPALRGRLASLAAFTSGPVRGRGMGREIIRHYTHLSERIDGLARGAGVPVDAVLALHAGALRGRGELQGDGAIATCGPASDARVLVQRTLPAIDGPGSAWLVRRSRPEVGFESIEVSLPWLASSIGGVNSAGLAACFVSRGEPPDVPDVPDGTPGKRPISLLLVQECLQRFETVEAGIDWCRSRPASGDASVLLADRAGRYAQVDFVGDSQEVDRGEKAQLVAGTSGDALERIREASAAGLGNLADFAELAGEITEPATALRLDPERRLLELRRGASREDLRLQV